MAPRALIGNRVAPARFILFFVLLVLAGTAAGAMLSSWWLGVMVGFDFAALVFIASCIPFFSHTEKEMRRAAAENDANRAILLVIAFILSTVVLVAVASQMASEDKATALDIALAIGTLVMAWLFANMVYALHYAHLFYSRDDGGKDNAGVKFPGTPLPDFPDFVYFAFTIGCSFAVSDTEVTSPHVRKVVTAHAVAAFLYSVGVLALMVNLLPGQS